MLLQYQIVTENRTSFQELKLSAEILIKTQGVDKKSSYGDNNYLSKEKPR